MKFGVNFPTDRIEPTDVARLSREAEEAGWDGVFIWDCMDGLDPWVSLAAAAMSTERVRLGTLVTPVSRRRPWKLAQETATLDRLSGGRVILSVGLGAINTGFDRFGEELDRKIRAAMLDEGLDVLAGLWSGKPFSYRGTHYSVKDTMYYPVPVQRPRIPVWVVGAWPREKSMQRALRWDGVIPTKMADGGLADMSPQDIEEMREYIRQNRHTTEPFDIVIEGETPGDDPEKAAEIVKPFIEAGATWWIESIWNTPRERGGLVGMRERIRQGPPAVDVSAASR